ncbi:small-conductance mechanosensitive channel [Larkinella arboricola]|uniref:Small-conductance mechanosensitive channel n=1 Tax=Larkinella arboricola TaxID=643671 RepID=A0A327X069_LARAB|nr:mechanosensitive ion channel domain-containing protein [Larkinella arboricola]RAJ97684.1 small-conductance mechanosensitive channel [Larkinella arboricola]
MNWTDFWDTIGQFGTEIDRWLRHNRKISGWLMLVVSIGAGLLVNLITTQVVRLILRRRYSEVLGLLRQYIRNAFYLFVPSLFFLIITNVQERAFQRFPIALKAAEIIFVASTTWLVVQLLKVGERLIVRQYDTASDVNLHLRKFVTQIRFVRQFFTIIVMVIGFSVLLLSFNGGRKIGLSFLTSAGIASVVIGFAAQRTIANLLAGIQIAFTQQIRVDDAVVVENEWGRIEEINLTNVVVRVWDRRRLILPITYFIEKPFQNWTRSQASVLGTVLLYLDYTVPVERIREKANQLVENNPLWDREVCAVQVTDIQPTCVVVRILTSARNSGESFDLRCFIRENILAFLRDEYPESLPKTRFQLSETNQPV